MSFEEAMKGSDVVIVVGSGVSAATTSSASTSTWVGLIRSGADRATSLDPSLDQGWTALVTGLLEYGSRPGRTDQIIQAAGMVSAALKAIGPQAFARWLSEDVGNLAVTEPDLAKAILAFPFPILTTNYDTLLEAVGDRASLDWTDSRFQKVVSRDSDAIGHLHGVWDKPDTIILGESDYQRLKDHPSTQALERAITSLKSIVYIGFGAGIQDPNFSALYQWQKETFSASNVTHYRLCQSDEQGHLAQLHAGDNVVPVVYGDSYRDLAPYLQALAPDRSLMVINDAGLARDVVQEARESLAESIAADSVLTDLLPAGKDASLLLLPPSLLPVPHSRYVREQMGRGQSPSNGRLDPYAVVGAHDLIVAVGDEGSGLTTAVKWLAAESSNLLGSAAPIFLRFRECRNKKDPLGTAVFNEARRAGLVSARGDKVPAHVLAIDDFDPTLRKVSDPVMDAIASGMSIVTVIGCREGNEEELVRGLNARGLSPRIVFLGRMSRANIAELAEQFAPTQGHRLAGEVIDHLESNGLKRTPLTVGLVLALITRGVVQDSKNATSILEAYVDLILSVGNPHDFPRGLTDRDVQAVLAMLAEHIVWKERTSLTESETVTVIESVIQGFGWIANPSEVFRFLLQRRILRERSGGIEFGRYSYLTTFAAKRAMADTEFRDLILDDLFYYYPVAIRYAALVRSDEELLERLAPVLDDALGESLDDGTPYEMTSGATIDSAEDRQFDSRPLQDPGDSEGGDFEFPERDFAGSFGLVRTSMPVAARLNRTLLLASSVLRDLDQVERLDVKRAYLAKILTLWGRLVAAVSSDPTLVEIRDTLIRQFTEDQDPRRTDLDFAEFLGKVLPAASVMGGMETSLASPKLSRLLEEAIESGEVADSTERETAALFMLLLVRSRGWAHLAERVAREASPTWIVTNFYHEMCRQAYLAGDEPEGEILSLCETLAVLGRSFLSPAVKGAWTDRYSHDLRLLRLRNGHLAEAPLET